MIKKLTASLLIVTSVLSAAQKYNYGRLTATMRLDIRDQGIVLRYGDRQLPDANVRTIKFENGLIGGKEYKAGRYTFTTKSAMRSLKFKEPLSSGLLGPVRIMKVEN